MSAQQFQAVDKEALEKSLAALSRVPLEMRSSPNWVGWKLVQKEKQPKPTKEPRQPRSPQYGADSTNPEHWGTLEAAMTAKIQTGLDGVGYVFTGTPHAGVDLDNAFDAGGALHPWAAEIVQTFKDCAFIEVSPSGTGLHIIVEGSLLPDAWHKKRPVAKDDPGIIEVYDTGRYFTVTGNVFNGCLKIGDGQAALDWLQAKYAKPEKPKPEPQADECSDLDDQVLIDRARQATNGALFSALMAGDTSQHGDDHSAADMALCSILAFWSGGDAAQIDRIFRLSGLMREKWDSRRGADTYGSLTIQKALELVQDSGESGWNSDAGQRAGKTNNSYSSYNSSDDLENWTPAEKTWPILQRAAMPGIIGDFVDVSTENSEADPAAVLATFLVRLGVEAGSPDIATRPHVFVGETRHEPRLFAVVTGKSSKARKGTSAQPVQRLFTAKGTIGAPSMGGVSFGPLSTGEGIIYAVRDALQEWKEKEQIFVTTDPGVTDKRLYVQEEELAAALSAGKREGNTLSATLRALWDSGTRSPMTKTSKTRCTDAHVGILAHITLDELALTLSDCDKLNGYANRFLWVLARRAKRVSRPTRIPESVFSPIQSTVWQRLNYAHKMGEMSISSEFWDVFDSQYDRLSEDRPGMAGAITARAEAQVVRLSMVYAIAAGTRTIGAEHIHAALAFWDYAQASAEYIFSDQTGGGKLDATIKALIEGAPDGLSMTELHEKTGRNHKAVELKASVQRLVDAGIVLSRSVRGPEDRKSRTVFFKNIPTNNTNYTNYSEFFKNIPTNNTNYTNYSEPPTGCVEQFPDEVTI
ncbi:MAG: hypothetical protein EOM03_15695 [Clostridia bacterium]|nr:hypothetical protein [Clostridia bacterium]